MFESSLLPILKNDEVLIPFVSLYKSSPAIFSEQAPENAEFPYIVFNIERTNDPGDPVQRFSVYVDYYNYGKSRVDSKTASERIELLLDKTAIEHERYICIRISFESGGSIKEDDPRAIHENLTFSARAGRKNWGEYKATEGD